MSIEVFKTELWDHPDKNIYAIGLHIREPEYFKYFRHTSHFTMSKNPDIDDREHRVIGKAFNNAELEEWLLDESNSTFIFHRWFASEFDDQINRPSWFLVTLCFNDPDVRLRFRLTWS